MSDEAQGEIKRASPAGKVKLDLSNYTEEELRLEGERSIQKRIEAQQRSQENFGKTKDLIYARKKRKCAYNAVVRELEKFRAMRRQEKLEVDKVNREKRHRKSRYSSPSDMISLLRKNLETLEEEDEEEEEYEEND